MERASTAGMRWEWITLAQVGVLLACSGSHEPDRDRDGGPEPDAGPGRADAGMMFDSGGRPELDAGPPRRPCDPEDARAITCPDLLCDGPGTWHWNGDSCFWIDCGACEGTDCGGPTSREECEAAHATCEATLCRSTGGTWKFWAEECEHYTCGRPGLGICDTGAPVCDCGPSMRFANGIGCVTEPACGERPPLSREELCRNTGGEWGALCCDSICGERCGDACLAPACHCPETMVFEDVRGCVEDARCFERRAGETCTPRARCENDGICCERCGGAGCVGPARCQAPVCDDDDFTDICGNRTDVP